MPPSDLPSDPVRTLPGARWSCRSCGACCRGFAFGPVEPEIVQGLIDRDIGAHWAPAAEAPWVERRHGPDGQEDLFFTHRDGHCVFLQDDARCALHARFGAEAKPTFCREYPFHVVRDAAGLAVAARADCGGLHHSFQDGEPVADQVAAVLDLPRQRYWRSFAPEQVIILPTAAVSASDWSQLEEVLLHQLGRERLSPEAAVAQARDLLHDLVNREAPAPDPHRYRLARAAVFDALRRTVSRVAPEADDGGYLARFTRELAAVVERAESRLGEPLPPLTDDALDYLGLVLRTELLLKEFSAVGGVPFGLGLFLVTCTAARLGAARADGPLDAAALGAILPRFKRLCANQQVLAVLRLARPALADLFLHVEG